LDDCSTYIDFDNSCDNSFGFKMEWQFLDFPRYVQLLQLFRWPESKNASVAVCSAFTAVPLARIQECQRLYSCSEAPGSNPKEMPRWHTTN
jgi:hypothetical protein